MSLLDILSKVGFDWRLAVMNLFNFLIIFFLLKKFLFGPITKKLDERKEFIAKGVEDARKAKTELQMAERKAQELLDDAKGQANTLLEAAHEQAKQQGEKMKAKAKEEIELLIAQAKKNIATDKAEMKEELRKETVLLVVHVVEKLLGEKMDSKKNEAYIQDMLVSMKK